MSCGGCERAVENALQNASGVRRADADHESGIVEVASDGSGTEDDLATTVHEVGYDVAT